MSRSGYSEDGDSDWAMIRWRGAVNSAIKGSRGQAFLKEMLAALDALPEKKLIAHELEQDGAVCALGAVGKARGIAMEGIDPEDSETVARTFGIAPALAKEIVFMNDEASYYNITPEKRYADVRAWVVEQIRSNAGQSIKARNR